MSDSLKPSSTGKSRDEANEKIPSIAPTPSEARSAHPPETAPSSQPGQTYPDDGQDQVPSLDIDPELAVTEAEGYAPYSNPDSPEVSGIPGITEVAPDSTAREIEEQGEHPEGPQRPNQQLV